MENTIPEIYNPIYSGKESRALPEMDYINDDNYYDDKTYITNSMLTMLDESPGKMQDYLDKKERLVINAFQIGDAVHKGVLEPEKYAGIITWSQDMLPQPEKTLRTKENAIWLAKFRASHQDSIVLSSKDHDQVEGMIESLTNKPKTLELLSDANYEQIALKFVQDVPMKSKGDIVRNDKTLVDIKTTANINIHAFAESCAKYGYYRQAALYSYMFNCTKFSFLCVEKKPPYQVAIYEVSEQKLKEGWQDILRLINRYKKYFLEQPTSNQISQYIIEGTL